MRHGQAITGRRTPTYRSWYQMRHRCKSDKDAKYYRDKGIKCCARWDSFENFLADMGERPPGHSIDRIDASRDYEPGNCRWATPAEQNRHKSDTRLITIDGVTHPLYVWPAILGIVKRSTVSARIRNGWDPVRALTEPAEIQGRQLRLKF